MRLAKRLGSVILICALLAVLVGMLLFNRRQQKAETAELKRLARSQAETVSDHESLVTASSEGSPVESGSGQEVLSASSRKETGEALPEKTEEAGVFSIRGDSFQSEGDNAPEESYPFRLQELLRQNGKDYTVADHTWEMAGTLSQMSLAGVEVQTYIDAHRQAAADAGVEPGDYDVIVRDDLDQKLAPRDDLDAVPILCMGYFGGYGGSFAELAEQERAILNTYRQQERYLVLGLYPSGTEDYAAYDAAMQEAFGDHYLSLSQQIDAAAMSAEGRRQIAEAVYRKLDQMGYLS